MKMTANKAVNSDAFFVRCAHCPVCQNATSTSPYLEGCIYSKVLSLANNTHALPSVTQKSRFAPLAYPSDAKLEMHSFTAPATGETASAGFGLCPAAASPGHRCLS